MMPIEIHEIKELAYDRTKRSEPDKEALKEEFGKTLNGFAVKVDNPASLRRVYLQSPDGSLEQLNLDDPVSDEDLCGYLAEQVEQDKKLLLFNPGLTTPIMYSRTRVPDSENPTPVRLMMELRPAQPEPPDFLGLKQFIRKWISSSFFPEVAEYERRKRVADNLDEVCARRTGEPEGMQAEKKQEAAKEIERPFTAMLKEGDSCRKAMKAEVEKALQEKRAKKQAEERVVKLTRELAVEQVEKLMEEQAEKLTGKPVEKSSEKRIEKLNQELEQEKIKAKLPFTPRSTQEKWEDMLESVLLSVFIQQSPENKARALRDKPKLCAALRDTPKFKEGAKNDETMAEMIDMIENPQKYAKKSDYVTVLTFGQELEREVHLHDISVEGEKAFNALTTAAQDTDGFPKDMPAECLLRALEYRMLNFGGPNNRALVSGGHITAEILGELPCVQEYLDGENVRPSAKALLEKSGDKKRNNLDLLGLDTLGDTAVKQFKQYEQVKLCEGSMQTNIMTRLGHLNAMPKWEKETLVADMILLGVASAMPTKERWAIMLDRTEWGKARLKVMVSPLYRSMDVEQLPLQKIATDKEAMERLSSDYKELLVKKTTKGQVSQKSQAGGRKETTVRQPGGEGARKQAVNIEEKKPKPPQPHKK